jgi:hypothetical protein
MFYTHIRLYSHPTFIPSTPRTSAMGNTSLPTTDANEVQHDAVLDYYGRRLATCSSDKTIKIFEVEGEKHTLVETLRGYVTRQHHVQQQFPGTRSLPCGT